jgi:cell division protein FtsL
MEMQKEERKFSLPKLVEWLSPFSITKNILYIIVVFALSVIYISNSNKATAVVKEHNKKINELKEERWRNRDLQSRIMNLTTEHKMIEKSAKYELKPLDKPAFEIKK